MYIYRRPKAIALRLLLLLLLLLFIDQGINYDSNKNNCKKLFDQFLSTFERNFRCCRRSLLLRLLQQPLTLHVDHTHTPIQRYTHIRTHKRISHSFCQFYFFFTCSNISILNSNNNSLKAVSDLATLLCVLHCN